MEQEPGVGAAIEAVSSVSITVKKVPVGFWSGFDIMGFPNHGTTTMLQLNMFSKELGNFLVLLGWFLGVAK